MSSLVLNATTGTYVRTLSGVGGTVAISEGKVFGLSGGKVYCYGLVATPPTANFSADIVSGVAPLTVQFTDSSIGAATWAWDFDNNGVVDSTAQNPNWTYAAGTYTVKLTVTNTYGSNTVTKTNYVIVTVPPAPSANFAADVTAGNAPLSVQFTDQSTNSPTSWQWDFDNNGVVDSTAQNPSYIYNSGIL